MGCNVKNQTLSTAHLEVRMKKQMYNCHFSRVSQVIDDSPFENNMLIVLLPKTVGDHNK
jgi:hypothetical protein